MQDPFVESGPEIATQFQPTRYKFQKHNIYFFVHILLIMATTNPGKLFSVEGMVVVITGGGTGLTFHPSP